MDDEVVSPELHTLDDVALEMAENLIAVLRELKITHPRSGRLWAIGVTDAEKLYAWIAYVVGTMDDSADMGAA